MSATFSDKDDDEIISVGFDFASLLATGETISTAVFGIRSVGANDTGAAAMLSGAATIAGSIATQKIIAGQVGVNYRVSCTITTSAGLKYVESADLAVTERE